MRKYGAIIIVLLISALILLAYYSWTNRPEQSVINMFKSIETKDKFIWDKSVAQKTIVHNSYKTYKNNFVTNNEDDLFLAIYKMINYGSSSMFETGNINDINSALNDYFTSNKEELLIFDKELLFTIFDNIDHSSLRVLTVKTEKNLAMVEFSFRLNFYDYDLIVRSVLEQQDRRWKVIGIVNLNQLIEVLRNLEKERRNNTIKIKTQEMQKKLEITSYYGIRKDFWVKDYPILNAITSFRTRHFITVTNTSNQVITKFSIKMTYKDSQDLILVEKQLNHENPLNPGKKLKMRFDIYDLVVDRQMKFGNSPELSHISITMESGQIIENEENKELRFYK